MSTNILCSKIEWQYTSRHWQALQYNALITVLCFSPVDTFEVGEEDRPQFKPTAEIVSYIDGSKMRHFPMEEQLLRTRISLAVITLLSLFVLTFIGGVFYLKYYLVNVKHMEGGDWIADGILSTFMVVCRSLVIEMLRFTLIKDFPTHSCGLIQLQF
jgi:hypothetical protein